VPLKVTGEEEEEGSGAGGAEDGPDGTTGGKRAPRSPCDPAADGAASGRDAGAADGGEGAGGGHVRLEPWGFFTHTPRKWYCDALPRPPYPPAPPKPTVKGVLGCQEARGPPPPPPPPAVPAPPGSVLALRRPVPLLPERRSKVDKLTPRLTRAAAQVPLSYPAKAPTQRGSKSGAADEAALSEEAAAARRETESNVAILEALLAPLSGGEECRAFENLARLAAEPEANSEVRAPTRPALRRLHGAAAASALPAVTGRAGRPFVWFLTLSNLCSWFLTLSNRAPLRLQVVRLAKWERQGISVADMAGRRAKARQGIWQEPLVPKHPDGPSPQRNGSKGHTAPAGKASADEEPARKSADGGAAGGGGAGGGRCGKCRRDPCMCKEKGEARRQQGEEEGKGTGSKDPHSAAEGRGTSRPQQASEAWRGAAPEQDKAAAAPGKKKKETKMERLMRQAREAAGGGEGAGPDTAGQAWSSEAERGKSAGKQGSGGAEAGPTDSLARASRHFDASLEKSSGGGAKGSVTAPESTPARTSAAPGPAESGGKADSSAAAKGGKNKESKTDAAKGGKKKESKTERLIRQAREAAEGEASGGAARGGGTEEAEAGGKGESGEVSSSAGEGQREGKKRDGGAKSNALGESEDTAAAAAAGGGGAAAAAATDAGAADTGLKDDETLKRAAQLREVVAPGRASSPGASLSGFALLGSIISARPRARAPAPAPPSASAAGGERKRAGEQEAEAAPAALGAKVARRAVEGGAGHAAPGRKSGSDKSLAAEAGAVAAPQRAVAPGFALLGSSAWAAGRKGPPAGGEMAPRTDAGADKAGKRKGFVTGLDYEGDADPAVGVGGGKRRKGDGDGAGEAPGRATGKKEKGKGKGTTAPAAAPAAPRAADFGKTEWRVTGGMVAPPPPPHCSPYRAPYCSLM